MRHSLGNHITCGNAGAVFGGDNPPFPALRSGPTAVSGAARQKQIPSSPGRHTIIKPKAGPNGRTFHAMFYYRAGDKVKPFFSSTWPLSKRARALIFFYHDPESNRLRIHSLRDYF